MDREEYAQTQAPDTGGMLAVNYWLGFLSAVNNAEDRCTHSLVIYGKLWFYQ